MTRYIPILRHVPHESAGTFENVLREMGADFRYIDLFQEHFEPLDLKRACGLVVLGGPMNVDETDKYPHLAREVEWIKQALAAGLPILGICLGAQLLAKALGARVYPNPVKEIGWYSAASTHSADLDALFEGCGKRFTVFQWHGDTFDLPNGAVRLVESELCRNQAFRYGRGAYGVQFHIEMTEEMIDSWIAQSAASGEFAGVDYVDLGKIREQTGTELPVLEALADKVLGRFVRLCWEKTRLFAKRHCYSAD